MLSSVSICSLAIADVPANGDVAAQISSIDKQIEELNRERNEEAMQALVIRRQAMQKQGQESQDAIQQQKMHMDKANEIDQKIAVLQQQKASLQGQYDSHKS